jgi:broad specificity phosphatase PhoE
MTPKQILLMRHAEKPDDPTDPHLSDAGRARAEKLADYVPKNPEVPDFLCASAPSKNSVRPIETITPLSKKIGVSIDSTIADQDCPVLAQELLTDPKYDGKLVLICWHHGYLPELAFGLGAAGANVPNPWDPNVFNLILNLDYSKGSKPTVTQITEPF